MTLKMIRYLGLATAASLTLSSCGISKGACLSAYQSGEHLSMQGLNHLDQAAFQKTYKECKTKYKITLNYNKYIQYWNTGRNEYCGQDSATSLGSKNSLNIAICDYDSANWDKFKQGYKKGLQTYWQQQGQNNGSQGIAFNKNLNNNQQQYANHDIFYNPQADYTVGYQKGAITFCTYTSGYNYGSKGSTNHQICKQYVPSKNIAFLSGYKKGLETNFCIKPVVYKAGLNGEAFPQVCNQLNYRKTALMTAWDKGTNVNKQIAKTQTQLNSVNKNITTINTELTNEQKLRDSYTGAILNKQNTITSLLANKTPQAQQINIAKSQIAQLQEEKVQALDKINDLQNQLSRLQYQQQTLNYTMKNLKLQHA
jgi:hypothetical protein